MENHPPVELTVIIKGNESTYRQKFLVYERIELTRDNEVVNGCIKEAESQYNGDVEEVIIRAKVSL